MILWIPGELIALITFPGVIIHEMAHQLACDIFYVPIYEVNYFRPLDATAGHVRHADTRNFYTSFLIGVAPFVVNSIVCVIFTLAQGIVFLYDTSFSESLSLDTILRMILYWAGLSIGFNAIPSKQDLSLWNKANSYAGKLCVILIRVFFWPFNTNFIGPIMSLLYAVTLSMVLPLILVIKYGKYIY